MLRERTAEPDPGVVDQHIRIEPVTGECRRNPFARIRSRDIEHERHRQGAMTQRQAIRCRGQRRFAASDQHQGRAGAGKPLGDGETDAFRCAGDHHRGPSTAEAGKCSGIGLPIAAQPDFEQGEQRVSHQVVSVRSRAPMPMARMKALEGLATETIGLSAGAGGANRN